MLKEEIIKIIGKRHIAGANLSDALKVCRMEEGHNWGTIISAWTYDDEDKVMVAAKNKEILEVIVKEKLNSALSFKPHAIDYDMDLFKVMIQGLENYKIRIHIDSLFPETAEKSLEFFHTAKLLYDNIGYTLPSRWKRSLSDADVMISHNTPVRIVKGQWIDKSNPGINPRKSFIELVEKLADRVPHIGIATHDIMLAKRVFEIAKRSSTEFELEQLFSLPQISGKLSRDFKIKVRIYVPYGTAYMPYSVNQMRVRPAILFWMLRDLLNIKKL